MPNRRSRRRMGLVTGLLLCLAATSWAIVSARRREKKPPLVMCPGVWDVLSIGAPTLLSSNGRVLAVSGLATGSTPVEDRMATWFVDVDQGEVLARTTPGCFLIPVKAGPGESYVLLVMSPERQAGLYWVQSACAVPVRLDGPGRRVPGGSTVAQVDFRGEWAAVNGDPGWRSREEGRWSFTAYAIDLRTETPAWQIGGGLDVTGIVDVVEGGAGASGPLAMLAGSLKGSEEFVLALVDVVSGDMAAAVELGVPVGIVEGPAEYGPGKVLVAVEERNPTVKTHVVEVDWAQGLAHHLAVVPDSCLFVTTVPTSDGMRAFVGGFSSVWELVSSPTGTVAREVVSVTAPSIPRGVRDAGRGPEVLLAMLRSRTIWRYSLDYGEMELVIGHAEGSNEAPEIVR